MRRLLKSVDRIIATSPNYLESSNVLKLYKDKVQVIPIGLDRSTYACSDQRNIQKWRERLGEKFFLFVGTLRYYKGLHILLEALRGIDYPVVIVGAGPTEAQLRRHAKQIGLSNVHFLGSLAEEDKVAIYELSYSVVFPSNLRSEAFGIALLEGAMFGKPMISSEIGTGTSFVNVHGETGLVVPPNEPDALREALVLMYNDTELASQMGRNAQQRFEKYFTAEKMVDCYTSLYSELLSQTGYNSARDSQYQRAGWSELPIPTL
jgi:rhamnosyl/mannosyltransferase